MSNANDLLTIEEATQRLKIGRTKVYELMDRGELQAINIDKCRRVLNSSVDAFIARKLKEAADA